MNKRDIHNLIEQQDSETKQRTWERIQSQLGDAPAAKQTTATVTKPRTKWTWAIVAITLVVVTLSVVLPLTLTGDGVRYCDMTQYTREVLEQTLQEYSLSHNNELLYVDWYDVADDVTTTYAHINGNSNDIVFFDETTLNAETGVELVLSVTDNKTRVDKFEHYYENYEEITVSNITVKWRTHLNVFSLATFEYQNHVYYLQLDVGDAKDQLVEIIENMLPSQ